MKLFTNVKKILNSTSFLLYAKTNLFILSFLIFALFFKPGTLFYEGKLYVQYLVSFLQDFDFNLLNQVPQSMAWLITPTFHHPDQHPEAQTALMLPFYLLEFISKKMSFTGIPASAFEFQYSLTTLAMNIFSLSLGFYFMQQICKQLNIKFHKFDFMFFTMGTALFYFSFLQSSVLEVTAFPLLAYLLMVYFNVRAGLIMNSGLTTGICAAFLLISKITFWPLAITVVLLIAAIYIKNRMWRKLAILIAPVAFTIAAHMANRFIKYGFILYDFGPPLKPFFDASFENYGRNLLLGFFPPGGLFFANPIYLLAVLGFFLLLKKLSIQKNISYTLLFVMLFWFALVFLGHIFIAGYIVEDHLPGRIHLGFMPLLLLGFIYLNSRIPEKLLQAWRVLLTLCCVWHLFITFCYLVMIQGNSLIYASNMIPSLELFSSYWPEYMMRVKDNASGVAAHLVQIVVFSVLLTLCYLALTLNRQRDKLMRAFSILCLICFVLMSLLNANFYRYNIEVMRRQGFYLNVAIGKGMEIFYLDYVLQYVSTVKNRCTPSICEKLDLGVEQYYSKVKEQVIKSTPLLDQAIANNASDFSFWIDIEKNKKSVNE